VPCAHCDRLRGTEDEFDRDFPAEKCRWCAEPSAYVWQFEGEPHCETDFWRLQSDWEVCAICHELTVAGNDEILLDRAMVFLGRGLPALSSMVRYESMRNNVYGVRVRHWRERRTTFEKL
jgi:hypothetical protein